MATRDLQPFAALTAAKKYNDSLADGREGPVSVCTAIVNVHGASLVAKEELQERREVYEAIRNCGGWPDLGGDVT